MKEYNLQQFKKEKWAFVLIKNEKVAYQSKERGLKPLLFCLKEKRKELRGGVVFDKIVGRAAALLLLYGKVKKIVTPIISRSAKELLEKEGMPAEWEKVIDRVMNREKSDLCPMEKLSCGKRAKEFYGLFN